MAAGPVHRTDWVFTPHARGRSARVVMWGAVAFMALQAVFCALVMVVLAGVYQLGGPPDGGPDAAEPRRLLTRVVLGLAPCVAMGIGVVAYAVRREAMARRGRLRLDDTSLEWLDWRGRACVIDLASVRSLAVAPAPGTRWPLDSVLLVSTASGRHTLWGCLDDPESFVAALADRAGLLRVASRWPWVRYRAPSD